MSEEQLKTKLVHNQPYDEEVSISDDGEGTDGEASNDMESLDTADVIPMPNPEPLPQKESPTHQEINVENDEIAVAENTQNTNIAERIEAGTEILQGEPELSVKEDIENLNVPEEVKEIFSYITAYRPVTMDLETELMPFIPEYIPAIGEIDDFVKIPRPDGKPDYLGLKVLGEPSLQQSDPTVLNLQLKALSKQSSSIPVAVSHIEDADSHKGRINKWIKSIEELHDTKPRTEVRYKTKMPEFDKLMEEWPQSIDEFIKNMHLPNESLDVDNRSFLKIVCSILDIPIEENLVESLHVLFSLYLEFRDNPHFKSKFAEQRE